MWLRSEVLLALLAGGAMSSLAIPESSAIDIQPNYCANVTQPQRDVIDAKIALWEARIPGDQVVSIEFCNASLEPKEAYGPGVEFALSSGGTVLATTDQYQQDPITCVPTGARIRFTTNPAINWYWNVNPTVPAGQYDGWTVTNHELCHALGFANSYSCFAARVTDGPDTNRTYTFLGGEETATLTPSGQGTHLSPSAHAGDLMVPSTPTGIRRMPSTKDVAILCDAFPFGMTTTSTCMGTECDLTFKSIYSEKTCRITYFMKNNQTVFNTCFTVEGINFSTKNLEDETTFKSEVSNVLAAMVLGNKTLCCGDDISVGATCTTCNEQTCTVSYWKATGFGPKPGRINLAGAVLRDDAFFSLEMRSRAATGPGGTTIVYEILNRGANPSTVKWQGSPFDGTVVMPLGSVVDSIVGVSDTAAVGSFMDINDGDGVSEIATVVDATSVSVGSTVSGPDVTLEIRLLSANPLKGSDGARFKYVVPHPGSRVRIGVYDVGGREIITVVDEVVGPGEYVGFVEGQSLAQLGAGVYFLRLACSDFVRTQKLTVIR